MLAKLSMNRKVAMGCLRYLQCANGGFAEEKGKGKKERERERERGAGGSRERGGCVTGCGMTGCLIGIETKWAESISAWQHDMAHHD